jgi:hypothetical protein
VSTIARHVLLSFDSNEEAEAFVASVQKMQGALVAKTVEDGGTQIVGVQASVRGVYMKPTKFCGCPHSKDDKGSARGKKYGLWVHAGCGMPTRKYAEETRWEGTYSSLGRNLLPVDAEHPEWRGEGVRGHRWDPEQKVWINVFTNEPYLGHTTEP